jgi:hypothetical protein
MQVNVSMRACEVTADDDEKNLRTPIQKFGAVQSGDLSDRLPQPQVVAVGKGRRGAQDDRIAGDMQSDSGTDQEREPNIGERPKIGESHNIGEKHGVYPIKEPPKSIRERHDDVEPKIDAEEPKTGKSSKMIPGSKNDPQWTEQEMLQWNVEPKIGYMYNQFENTWYCNACDKKIQDEWACWCHILSKPECQYIDEVRRAVEEYNKSKNTST